MDDHRRDPRTQLIYSLKLFDPNSHQFIGQVLDLSRCGLRIISVLPIQKGNQYLFAIEDLNCPDEFNTIQIAAICRWSQSDANRLIFDAGLEYLTSNQPH